MLDRCNKLEINPLKGDKAKSLVRTWNRPLLADSSRQCCCWMQHHDRHEPRWFLQFPAGRLNLFVGEWCSHGYFCLASSTKLYWRLFGFVFVAYDYMGNKMWWEFVAPWLDQRLSPIASSMGEAFSASKNTDPSRHSIFGVSIYRLWASAYWLPVDWIFGAGKRQ